MSFKNYLFQKPVNEELSVYENRKNLIEKYMTAVQSNQTDLIKEVFIHDASLEIKAHTTYVSFPKLTKNAEEVAKVLVKDFGEKYENISTFCFIDTLSNEKDSITCNILICMQEKESKSILLSYGLYVWEFSEGSATKVSKLNIEIEKLLVLNPSQEKIISTWISNLPQYWVERKEVLKSMPSLQHIKFLKDKLKEKEVRSNILYTCKVEPKYPSFKIIFWTSLLPIFVMLTDFFFPDISKFFNLNLSERRISNIQDILGIYVLVPSMIIASFMVVEIDSKFTKRKRSSYKFYYFYLIPMLIFGMITVAVDVEVYWSEILVW